MRVVVPNKTLNKIDNILKELHLLKVAVKQESEEKLDNRILNIRRELLEVREEINKDKKESNHGAKRVKKTKQKRS